MPHEFWVYIPTGRAWAVELVNGRVVAAAGPLRAEDAIPDLLDHLPYSATDVHWIVANRSAFHRKDDAERWAS